MEDWEAIRLNFVICKNSRRAHYLLLEFNSTIAKLKCNAPSLIEISETAFFTETNSKTDIALHNFFHFLLYQIDFRVFMCTVLCHNTVVSKESRELRKGPKMLV